MADDKNSSTLHICFVPFPSSKKEKQSCLLRHWPLSVMSVLFLYNKSTPLRYTFLHFQSSRRSLNISFSVFHRSETDIGVLWMWSGVCVWVFWSKHVSGPNTDQDLLMAALDQKFNLYATHKKNKDTLVKSLVFSVGCVPVITVKACLMQFI